MIVLCNPLLNRTRAALSWSHELLPIERPAILHGESSSQTAREIGCRLSHWLLPFQQSLSVIVDGRSMFGGITELIKSFNFFQRLFGPINWATQSVANGSLEPRRHNDLLLIRITDESSNTHRVQPRRLFRMQRAWPQTN
jgi:hypothetical protein